VVERTVEALNDALKPLKGSEVLVLGVSYKPDVDDVRESPALDIIKILRQRGAVVDFHDPYVAELEIEGVPESSVELSAELLERADAVVITTDHSSVDYGLVGRHANVVVDPRNAMKEACDAVVYPIAGPPRAPGTEARQTA
jgi:UDP-N-acetyl-D-glucosamine dehydrogenase